MRGGGWRLGAPRDMSKAKAEVKAITAFSGNGDSSKPFYNSIANGGWGVIIQ